MDVRKIVRIISFIAFQFVAICYTSDSGVLEMSDGVHSSSIIINPVQDVAIIKDDIAITQNVGVTSIYEILVTTAICQNVNFTNFNFAEKKKRCYELMANKINSKNPVFLKAYELAMLKYYKNIEFMHAVQTLNEEFHLARKALESSKEKKYIGINLSGSCLSGLDLSNINLSGAILVGVDFSHANLEKSYLVGADVTNAIFINTKLDDADFRDADLTNAIFTRASLIGTVVNQNTKGLPGRLTEGQRYHMDNRLLNLD